MLLRILAIASLFLTMACVQNRTIGDRIDDSAAGLNLKSRLLFDREAKSGDIDMTIFEGRLLLTGTVRSEADAEHIIGKARTIPQVREVISEIKVAPRTTFGQGTRDALIDNRLEAALIADTGVKAGNYRILVSQGTVYLLGVAAGPGELQRVTAQASTIEGVNEVVSHVIYLRDPRRPQK